MSNINKILAIDTHTLRGHFSKHNPHAGAQDKIAMAKWFAEQIDKGMFTLDELGLGTAQTANQLASVEQKLNTTANIQTQQGIDLQRLTAQLAQVESHIGGIQVFVLDEVKKIAAHAGQLQETHNAQLANVLAKLESVNNKPAPLIDPASVSAEVARVVADAFKPLRELVDEKGLAEVVADKYANHVIKTVDAGQLFGVSDVVLPPVDIWNSPDAPAIDPLFIWQAPIVRHLVQSQVTGENCWLGGEKGTGKTQTCMQFAAITGRPFTRINFHKYTTAEEYLGSAALVNGNTVFEAGDFLKAYTTAGSVILLDEITNADPAELAPLNALLEPNARVNIGGQVWQRAAGVLVFGADNTLGSGDASGRYAGVRQMNAALLDRFARSIHFGFLPRDTERQALMNHTGCTQKLADHVLDVVDVCRQKLAEGALVDAPSLRQAIAFIKALHFHALPDAWNCTIASKQPIEGAIELAGIYAAHVNPDNFII